MAEVSLMDFYWLGIAVALVLSFGIGFIGGSAT